MRSFGQLESELKVWVWMTMPDRGTDAGVLLVVVEPGSMVPEAPEVLAGSDMVTKELRNNLTVTETE